MLFDCNGCVTFMKQLVCTFAIKIHNVVLYDIVRQNGGGKEVAVGVCLAQL